MYVVLVITREKLQRFPEGTSVCNRQYVVRYGLVVTEEQIDLHSAVSERAEFIVTTCVDGEYVGCVLHKI
jgi:hypothetical protein